MISSSADCLQYSLVELTILPLRLAQDLTLLHVLSFDRQSFTNSMASVVSSQPSSLRDWHDRHAYLAFTTYVLVHLAQFPLQMEWAVRVRPSLYRIIKRAFERLEVGTRQARRLLERRLATSLTESMRSCNELLEPAKRSVEFYIAGCPSTEPVSDISDEAKRFCWRYSSLEIWGLAVRAPWYPLVSLLLRSAPWVPFAAFGHQSQTLQLVSDTWPLPGTALGSRSCASVPPVAGFAANVGLCLGLKATSALGLFAFSCMSDMHRCFNREQGILMGVYFTNG